MLGVGMAKQKPKAAFNLLPHSVSLTNASWWTAVGATVANGAADPIGGTAGFLLTEPAGSGSYGVSAVDAANRAAILSGRAVTASLYAKAGTCSWLRLILADSVTTTIGAVGWFNVSAGTKGTASSFAGSPTSIASTIQSAGNGWFLCCLTAKLGSAVTAGPLIRLASADATGTDIGGLTMTTYLPQITQA